MHAPLDELQIAALISSSAGIFSIASFVQATVSGWRRLAKRYSAGEFEPDRRKYLVWARVGRVTYQHYITVGGDERGLYLAPLYVLRMFHTPLLIPWSDIQVRTRKLHFFMNVDILDLGEGLPQLRIESEALDPFLAYLPSAA
ncbi:hypothetical protein [Myxococcus hansupus]|uniref:hypothetical protein n=1 Tax=Pseudomyxococcus hansupus TaxID=1297742 RepID=UPI0002FDDAED|nr:hypothetical protein [Myxococcus hansupus]